MEGVHVLIKPMSEQKIGGNNPQIQISPHYHGIGTTTKTVTKSATRERTLENTDTQKETKIKDESLSIIHNENNQVDQIFDQNSEQLQNCISTLDKKGVTDDADNEIRDTVELQDVKLTSQDVAAAYSSSDYHQHSKCDVNRNIVQSLYADQEKQIDILNTSNVIPLKVNTKEVVLLDCTEKGSYFTVDRLKGSLENVDKNLCSHTADLQVLSKNDNNCAEDVEIVSSDENSLDVASNDVKILERNCAKQTNEVLKDSVTNSLACFDTDKAIVENYADSIQLVSNNQEKTNTVEKFDNIEGQENDANFAVKSPREQLYEKYAITSTTKLLTTNRPRYHRSSVSDLLQKHSTGGNNRTRSFINKLSINSCGTISKDPLHLRKENSSLSMDSSEMDKQGISSTEYLAGNVARRRAYSRSRHRKKPKHKNEKTKDLRLVSRMSMEAQRAIDETRRDMGLLPYIGSGSDSGSFNGSQSAGSNKRDSDSYVADGNLYVNNNEKCATDDLVSVSRGYMGSPKNEFKNIEIVTDAERHFSSNTDIDAKNIPQDINLSQTLPSSLKFKKIKSPRLQSSRLSQSYPGRKLTFSPVPSSPGFNDKLYSSKHKIELPQSPPSLSQKKALPPIETVRFSTAGEDFNGILPSRYNKAQYPREETFQITPAGYDSRFADPVSIADDECSDDEYNVRKEAKKLAEKKCQLWLKRYNVT